MALKRIGQEKALQTRSSESTRSLRIPSLRDEQAWKAPSNQEHVRLAVAKVLARYTPNPKRLEIRRLMEDVQNRNYTAAELAWVAEELLYDPVLTRRLDKETFKIEPSDFDRMIYRLRRLRSALSLPLTRYDLNQLILDYPGQISLEDFGVSGFDKYDQPLFRYSKSGPIAKAPSPRPQLTAADPRRLSRVEARTGTGSIGAVLPAAQVNLQSGDGAPSRKR